MKVEPVVLEGAHVRLEPLDVRHVEALAGVALDPGLWRWMLSDVRDRDDLERYVAKALAQRDTGRVLPFATVSRADRHAVGSTRFTRIEPAHRRVEIGASWIGTRWQRTALNTEAKYMMLRHAFEVWGCIRVAFRVDVGNLASRRAVLRLGAHEEATLRRHGIYPDGVARDVVCFSVIDEEWPAVKAHIEGLMRRA